MSFTTFNERSNVAGLARRLDATLVLGTDAARVAEGSADGTDLVLRARNADPAEKPNERWHERMWYEITYSLTDRDGREHVVKDNVYSPLKPEGFGTRFWTGEPHAIAAKRV